MRFPHRTQRNFYFALLFCCVGLLAFGLTRLSWQAGAAPQGNLVGQSLGQSLPDGIWQGSGTTRAKNATGQTHAFRLDPTALTTALKRAPMEFRARLGASQTLLTLPLPDGSLERFRIEESPIMEPSLAAQLPLVKTYRGQGLDDPTATVRFDWTPQGLHALILSAKGSFLVEPETPGDTLNYLARTTQTLDGPALMQCGVTEADVAEAMARSVSRAAGQPLAPAFSNGATLRTYRLAVAASGEYAANYGGGTVGGTQTAITSVVNLVDAIYEREMAVRFTLVNNTNIIFTNAATDPYSSGASGNTANSATLTANQTTLDNGALLGTANYDIGHLFGGITGLGPGSASFSGLATLGVVCVGGSKARGVSTMGGLTATLGIFINGIAHEIGHQFNAPHTFNGTLNNCGGGNRSSGSAYETGSGSTIMSYAGTCAGDNIVNNTDVRFHSKSFEVMLNFMTTTATCNTSPATGNTPPTANAGADFTIPKNTPFTLTATASDPDIADTGSLTHTWEQIDSGGASFFQDGTEASYNDAADPVGTTTRPIFRPFAPTTSLSRTFPSLTYILNNANDPPQLSGGLETAEELPRIGRTLNFRFTARDNRANGGGVTDDSMVLTVDNNSGPFLVTAPNTAVSWTGNTTQTVTWSVNSTNLAPVSCANVKISLSTDGGNTFPTTILASTANDGTENITVPNVNTTQARIKVEAVGNVFFDISNANFTITPGAGDGVAPTASLTANNVTTAGATTYTFTVTYSDNVAINVATLGNGDVNVSGPGGFNQAATFVSVDINTNGTPRTATYQITPPGGAWDLADNGTYTVTMNASQVADTSANNVAAGTLGTFMVNIGDVTVPTASVTAGNVTTAGGTTYQFTVTYSDNVAINVATLGNGDVNVSGPGGFNVAATFVSVNINTNGTPRTATYQITPPGGAWDLADNGTYTVTMNASQVADTSANNVAAGALGTFNVNIADATAPTASVTASNVTTAGGTTYQFTIAYSDNVAINVATLGNSDAQITGPGGFNVAASFVSVNINTNGTPRTATYSLTPPGGAWDLADNGTYTVTMNASQVADTSGNFAAAGPLGTFDVTIGCITSVTVNNTGDAADATPGNGVCETALGNGICTLRAAIQEANALPNCTPFTINFSALFNSAQTINLGTALPALDHPNLTINGTGANLVTVQRNAVANFRIFAVNAARTVTLNGLTITGGNEIGSGGGGVLNGGALTITNCQISGNASTGFGGGINNNNGTLTVTGSTIANNTTSTSNTGGGIDNTGPLTLLNTTLTGNTVTGNTGSNGGALWTNTQTTITNCTITNNAAAGPDSAGGLRRAANTTTIVNTIIAANQNNTTVPDVIADTNTGITSNGFNLIGNVGALGGVFNQAGDQTGTGANPRNPLLTVLQNNGGPTLTHALLPGSTAINTGTNTGAPATDQRGIARPQQTTTDIGAYESRGFTLAVVSGNNQSTLINTAFANPLVASVTSANGEPVNGGRVTFTPPGAGASATLTGNPATIAGGQASVNATANATAGGPYNVAANATGAAAAVNFALTNNAAGDMTAPTASVAANDVTTPGATSYQFTITYSDNVAINVATLGNGDANVSGPGGFNQAATFVSVNINTNGTPRTATYQITPPGGAWDLADNGTYTVTMNASQVADTNGNNVAAGTLGTFNVVIGCITSVTVNNVTDVADAVPGNGVCETGAGNGICTLRAAIQEANALPNCSPFTINFSVNGIFNLGTALPALDHPNLTINGPGANLSTVRRNAASLFRVFTNNAGRTATLSGLTISNGDVGGGDTGGGVKNFGTLTITNCTINGGNHANGGGGLANDGTLTMTGSTISGNFANFDGGGFYNFGNATATLTNCTISSNTGGDGLSSGLINAAGAGQSAMLTLTNCTVTANTGAGASQALRNVNFGGANAVTTQLRNTLLAGNTGANYASQGVTTLTSLGNNLDSDGSTGFSNGVSGNIVGTAGNPINALLDALGVNGGPTLTHALLPGSPAINTGTNTGAPATDQRGIARPQQTTTDIGAFESRGFTLAVVSGSGQATTINAAFANPLVVSVSSANAEPINGGRVSFTPPGAGASASLMTNPATITGGQASVMAVANATAGGPYNVAANATGAAAAVNFALTNNAADGIAPTATLSAANVTTAGGTTYTFTITYSDNVAINVATLGNSDAQISGPGGFNAAANFVSVNNNSNGTPRTATYSITPPGGTWDNADNGTYTVTMNANQVADTAGNFVAAGTLGTFSVTVSPGGNGLQFFPLAAPVRLLDTRPGASPNACSQPNAPIAGQTSRTQPGRNICTIPANAQALTGNVTTVQSGGGFLTLYPSDATQPTVASTNYGINEVINNVFTVGLGADGAFKIFANNTTDVVVDVTGYYAPPGAGGLYFHPLPAPVRLLETRAGQPVGCIKPGVPLTGGQDSLQTATTACTGIPAAARSVVGNATTVSPAGTGYLTLYPADVANAPLVASSNYNLNQIVNGPFTVGLSNAGQFKIFTTQTTHLVVDVLGYYSTEANDVNGAGLLFYPLAHPVRLLETRPNLPVGCFKPGVPLTGNTETTQTARGLCDGVTIPANALGVVGNATVVFPAGQGFLTLWPSTATRPTVATSNYNLGDVGNRHFIVGLGQGDGAFKLYTQATTHLVIDLSGYFAP